MPGLEGFVPGLEGFVPGLEGFVPGLEGPKTPAYRIQGCLGIMAALGNLAVWLHAQILVERAF